MSLNIVTSPGISSLETRLSLPLSNARTDTAIMILNITMPALFSYNTSFS